MSDEEPNQDALPKTCAIKKSYFGLIGLALGILALGVTVIYYSQTAYKPKKSVEKKASDAVERFLDKLEDKLKNAPPKQEESPAPDYRQVVYLGTVAASLAGILCVVFAYIRKENRRLWISAAALSLFTLLLQYLAMHESVVVIIIALVIIVWVFGAIT